MLILTRKPGESLYIGDSIKITIVELKGHQIRVGIDAPKEMRIYREEIYLQILEENKNAAESSMADDSALEGLSKVFGGKLTGSVQTSKSGGESGNEEMPDGEGQNDRQPGHAISASFATGLPVTPRLSSLSSFGTSRKSDLKAPTVVMKRKKAKKTDE